MQDYVITASGVTYPGGHSAYFSRKCPCRLHQHCLHPCCDSVLTGLPAACTTACDPALQTVQLCDAFVVCLVLHTRGWHPVSSGMPQHSAQAATAVPSGNGARSTSVLIGTSLQQVRTSGTSLLSIAGRVCSRCSRLEAVLTQASNMPLSCSTHSLKVGRLSGSKSKQALPRACKQLSTFTTSFKAAHHM